MGTKIGFIGYGNMGQAMVNGMIVSGSYNARNIIVSDLNVKENVLGIKMTTDNTEVAKFADILVLAVKPHQYKDVIDEVKGYLKPSTIIVSIAAGPSICTLESYFDYSVKLIRTMPNTPAMIGIGMTAIMPNAHMTEEEVKLVQDIFDSFGKTEIVAEELIEAVIVTSGSSPAYVYMMIEAMIRGGMNEGMTREMATSFVCQAMIGGAGMVMKTGIHPNDLCDAVCSPNGTTIRAVNYLRDNDFEEVVKNAMKACAERSREMSK